MPTAHTASTVRQAFRDVLLAAGLGLTESQQVLGGPELDPAQLAPLRFSVVMAGEANTRLSRPAPSGYLWIEQEVVVRVSHLLRPHRGGAMLEDYDTAIGTVCPGIRQALMAEPSAQLAGIRVHYDRTDREQIDGQWLITDQRFRAQHLETTT